MAPGTRVACSLAYGPDGSRAPRYLSSSPFSPRILHLLPPSFRAILLSPLLSLSSLNKSRGTLSTLSTPSSLSLSLSQYLHCFLRSHIGESVLNY